jgi:2-oxoglutarate ferredoxin oxidoreductase subunit alpha
MSVKQLSIAITGAGGAGVISCGELLLQAWGRQSGRGFLRKAYGPQIRGGESAALLKLTDSERYTAASAYDVVVALDWDNFSRFEDEIRLGSHTRVICDKQGELPELVVASGAAVLRLPLAGMASEAHVDGRVNMLALGLLGGLLGLPVASLCELAEQKLQGKAEAYRNAASACIVRGAQQQFDDFELVLPATGEAGGWYISGNQAAGLGALEAGVRFVAAYPITPASDVLEWMAGGLEQVGGQLVQAEDELAAINMTIGAAFGGVPAFTATSGPGLALMTESIGLAVASETPITVFNVMRGGPSTGIPTKSEQSDLNIALHGLHGDAPHLVLAPLDIADCVFTTAWAVQLAQQLQTAAIVLSDQFIGQSSAIVSDPRRCAQRDAATLPGAEEVAYLRYELTASGVSTVATPGDVGRRFTADGLEHNEKGTPSAKQSDHQRQLHKRQQKLTDYSYGDDWAAVSGSGTVALLSFGSSSASVLAAAEQLAQQGIDARVISLRLLAPLQCAALTEALAGTEIVLVVEQNHSKQLFHYLRGAMDFLQRVHSYAMAGPVPLSPDHIVQKVLEVMGE